MLVSSVQNSDFWHLCRLNIDHHNNPSKHVSIQSCYNIFGYIFQVSIKSSWLLYFIIKSLYLLIFFTYFSTPHTKLLPDMCVLVAQSYLTLCNPWAVAHQAPLSMGFSKQEYWSGLPFPSPGYHPSPGINQALLYYRQILYHFSHQENLSLDKVVINSCCWSWSCNTLAIRCKEFSHWERP